MPPLVAGTLSLSLKFIKIQLVYLKTIAIVSEKKPWLNVLKMIKLLTLNG